MMSFLSSMQYQSTEALNCLNGSKMTPNVALVDLTAFRSGLEAATPTAG